MVLSVGRPANQATGLIVATAGWSGVGYYTVLWIFNFVNRPESSGYVKYVH